MNPTRISLFLAGVCLFQAGLILGQVVPSAALAQDPTDDPTEEAWQAPLPRLLCKTFTQDMKEPMEVETADSSTEIGAWIKEKEQGGWQLYMLDLDVGSKSTGFPQGWVSVCLSPR